MVISKSSVRRIFLENVDFLKLFSLPLKLIIPLPFFFLSTGQSTLNTAVNAAADSLGSSNKKAQKSINVTSNTSLNNGWRPQAFFFDRHAEGWHWYDTLRVESLSDNKVEEKKKNADSALAQTPTQMIEEQRKKLEQKLHAAILEPTREKIVAYILAQKALMDQSQRFSESWKRVVMTTPSLDETLIHPVDQNARHIYYQERHQDITKRIKALAQEYGLFFFFKGTCAYCHHFAPVVKHFTKKHGWSVLGISMDGGTLGEFPHAKKDNGMAARLQISHVPALIAYHPRSGEIIPLAYGLVSESEIEERVILLTQPSNSKTTRGGVTHEVKK